MRFSLYEIRKRPSVFKICSFCRSVNLKRNSRCHLCGTRDFREGKDEVLRRMEQEVDRILQEVLKDV